MTDLSTDFDLVKCVVFDFGRTLSSDFYFNVMPPDVPNWFETIQTILFSDQHLVDRWMRHEIVLEDVAAILAPHFNMSTAEAIRWSIKGCQHVKMNTTVWRFAEYMKESGRHISTQKIQVLASG